MMNTTDNRPSLGVIFHPSYPPKSLADFARRAEVAGFNELWLWDDCFLPGALTSAAIALTATEKIKVGIGLLPVPACNPLFAAMEITTLASAFPGRFIPGFGHGVASWMDQIGSLPKSPLKALEETLQAVRSLLAGETVNMQGSWVHLKDVQMDLIPPVIPDLYVGAIREKSLRLAGRLGDGTILTSLSSPAYIRWAITQINIGMQEAARERHRIVLYLDVKVNENRQQARLAARRTMAARLPWDDAKLEALGITREVEDFLRTHTTCEEIVRDFPEHWLDDFCAAGSVEEVAMAIHKRYDAGADAIIFEPLDGDPACLDEYITHLPGILNILSTLKAKGTG
ncbi:MAG: LLM class flavin-dependent oxidoreductase [Anaerolineaceae bacterium]